MEIDRSFFAKPYIDRQLVLFTRDDVVAANDRVVQALSRMRQHQMTVENQLDYFRSNLSHVPFDEMVKALGSVRAYLSARREGAEIHLVSRNSIGAFQLLPGHPRDNVIYAGHPAMPRCYVSVADFHRYIFEHKFSEVITLLMNLGAKTIHVKYVKGWGFEFSLKLGSVVLPPSVNSAELRGEVEQVVLFRTSSNSKSPPRLPANMIWYPHEPSWQWVAEGRMNFGLREFVLDMNYREDFDVGPSLKSKLEKAGLSLGGDFERHVPTVWSLFGEFWGEGE